MIPAKGNPEPSIVNLPELRTVKCFCPGLTATYMFPTVSLVMQVISPGQLISIKVVTELTFTSFLQYNWLLVSRIIVSKYSFPCVICDGDTVVLLTTILSFMTLFWGNNSELFPSFFTKLISSTLNSLLKTKKSNILPINSGSPKWDLPIYPCGLSKDDNAFWLLSCVVNSPLIYNLILAVSVPPLLFITAATWYHLLGIIIWLDVALGPEPSSYSVGVYTENCIWAPLSCLFSDW